MRPLPLVLLLAGALAAAEPVPLLDLDYEADGPRLPPPLAAWWDRALGDAAGWAASRSGVPLQAPSFAGITSLRLAGAALPSAAAGEPEAWAAGWVDGLDAPGEDALAALVARWPGCTLRHGGDGRIMVDAAGIMPPHRVALPGWRATLHGAALGNGLLPDETDPVLRERLLSAVGQWECTAITTLAGAWFEPGLPSRWFRAPDPRLAARLPPTAAAHGLLAVDGMALADDLERIFPSGSRPAILAGLREIPGVSVRGLASALTGTWAGWWDGAAGGLLSMPSSPVGDGLLRLLAANGDLILPTDAKAVRMRPGLFAAWDGDSWIFATDAAFIAAWQAEPASIPAVEGLGEVAISGPALARLLADLPLELVAQLPVSDTLHGGGNPVRGQLTENFGKALPEPAWRTACGALADLGESRIRLADHDGDLRLDLGGQLLPWVLPGLGLRWFADQGQDLVGRDLLRRTIARLRAEGAGALPEDLLAEMPAVDPARLAAAEEVLTATRAALKAAKAGGLWKRVRGEGVPLPDAPTPQLLAVVEATAGMDAADFPAASTMGLSRAIAARELGSAIAGALAGRDLTQAVRDLAALGRPEALVLARRVQRFLARPRLQGEWILALAAQANTDDAMLALGLAGVAGAADMAAWSSLPPPDAAQLAACWHAERLAGAGWVAALWLGIPGWANEVPAPGMGLHGGRASALVRPSPFAPHSERAEVAEDLVGLMETLRGLEAGRDPAEVLVLPRSRLVSGMIPAVGPMQSQVEERIIRHGLLRLAWRLHGLDPLPSDEAAAVAALAGPLQIPCRGAQLPLRFQRLPAGGFTLFLDPAAPMPATLRAERWKRWIEPAKPLPVERLAIMPNGRMAVIIDPAATLPPPPPAAPEAAAQPPGGANGF
jgi:hypothetical protein